MTSEEYTEIMDKSNFMIDSANPYDMEILEAIEKQIPKKPKIVETDNEGIDMETLKKCTYKIYDAHCSKCDSLIGSEYDKFSEHYCDVCGQRIDWSCWQKNFKRW